MPQGNRLLSADLMKKLDRLSIASRKLFSGAMKGKRRSIKRGSSVEFADYRDYQPGDDFRFIDWNIYSRLDKLFLKTFVEEENIYIHILLDVSPSMNFGAPSKLEYGKQIAAALGYIGLVDFDTVVTTTFAENINSMRPMRGKDRIFNLMSFLENIQISAKQNASLSLDTCLKKYAFSSKHQGVAIVISDFLVLNYEEGLKALLHKNFDVNVIHVLSEDELHPVVIGELKLFDAETDDTREVTITDRVLEKYQAKLANFCHNLKQFCTKNNTGYICVNTSIPLEDLMLRILRREQIVL